MGVVFCTYSSKWILERKEKNLEKEIPAKICNAMNHINNSSSYMFLAWKTKDLSFGDVLKNKWDYDLCMVSLNCFTYSLMMWFF